MMDNWKNTTALWDKLKKNLTAVRSQNNFWIIKPFYDLTILSFSFYLSSSILPLSGGHTLDRAPFTGLCLHLCLWPLYAFLLCFSLKHVYMFHPFLPSGVQSVYGISWWQLPGTYYRWTRSSLHSEIFEQSICLGCFFIRSLPSMNSIATKLSQRQFIFLFVCLFVYLCCISRLLTHTVMKWLFWLALAYWISV